MKRLLHLGISALLIGILLTQVDLSSLWQTVKGISTEWFIIIFVAYFSAQMLSTVKWWLLLRAAGVTVPYPRALRAYFLGMFVNSFGLGVVGGDAARGILVGICQERKAAAFTSVIADRVHGLAMLALVGSTGIAVFGHQVLPTELALALAAVGPLLIAGWFIGPHLLHLIPLPTKLRTVGEEIQAAFPKRKRVLVAISSISIVFHCAQILTHGLIATAIGAVHLGLSTLFVVVPYVNIASTLPISWNGLGVRETAYHVLLASGDTPLLTPEQAVAFGTIWVACVVIASIIGGSVALLSGDFRTLREERVRRANGGTLSTSEPTP